MNDNKNEILFEKFEIIETLKQDMHAAVHLAHHIYLDKKIILKVLDTKTIGEKVVIERFKREAKILAQLDDTNIIKVLDFGMFEEFFYISFEYFPSENLRQIITDQKLTLAEKEKLIVQIFKGLKAAHENNVIHRDIKPENILVNNLLELKIGDFGLAEVVNESVVTNKYSLVGTPSYMSPEQISGEKLTFQSDYFSAGIVVVELLTGSNPFLGKDITASINLITKFDESKTKFNLEKLPEKFGVVVNNLLKRNPEKRYSNADEVLKVLGVENNDKTILPMDKQQKSRKSFWVLVLVVLSIVFVFYYFFELNNSSSLDVQNSVNKVEKIPEQDYNLKQIVIAKENKINSNILVEAEFNNHKIANTLPTPVLTKENTTAKQNGEFFVNCLPWAEVYIDNKKIETTPLKNNIVLSEGKHELKLVHPNYPPFIDTIKITSTKTTKLSINLDAEFGFLDCKVFPWGSIYVDDIFVGETPLQKIIVLEPKRHIVEIKNPQFEKIRKIVTITKRDTFRLIENFKQNLD